MAYSHFVMYIRRKVERNHFLGTRIHKLVNLREQNGNETLQCDLCIRNPSYPLKEIRL